jgi:hypothetical protein
MLLIGGVTICLLLLVFHTSVQVAALEASLLDVSLALDEAISRAQSQPQVAGAAWVERTGGAGATSGAGNAAGAGAGWSAWPTRQHMG